MRRKIVAGNWKMNLDFSQADDLICEVADILSDDDLSDRDVVICPPFPYLEMATDEAEEADFYVGAQNVCSKAAGAYTGEVSAQMLAAMNINYCIVGHSERRKIYFETNKDVSEKIDRLMEYDITPIVCVGENLTERESGNHFNVIKEQISEGLFHLSKDKIQDIIIAYEPVWAIGTGKTASSEQAQEIHKFIRTTIDEHYGQGTSECISILYGGSCNATNAQGLFAMPDIDGGLIGGASLNAKDFCSIVRAL
ncbi:MAG: triose-phosphate isomerase [Bacteroidales bacterium]|jgi:triosephosphate isomerase|nr:triose-phosphate isomerase [Bacteroidales bacterium]